MKIKKLLLSVTVLSALLFQVIVPGFGIEATAENETMLFEDFDSSLGLFSTAGAGKITLDKIDGKSVAALNYRASINYTPPKNAVDWNGSYSMVFYAKTDDWNTNDAPELIFRIHSEGNRTYYCNYSNGRVSLMRLLPEGQDTIASTQAANAYVPEETQFNEFRVDVINSDEGVRCRVQINSVTMLDYTDMSSKMVRSGGITITSNKQEGSIYIDNVTVTKINQKSSEKDNLKPSPDTMNSKFRDEYTVIRQLGIMPSSDDGLFNGDYIMTRAEYVDAVVKMFTETPLRGEAYNDVKETASYSESVYTAKIFGIIGDKPAFRPNDKIAFNDAVDILMKAMGYSALNLNGQTDSSMVWAVKLKLLDGIDEQNSKKSTLAKLLFNALDVAMVNPVFKQNSTEYRIDGEDTVLSRRNIIKGRGVYSNDGVTEFTRKRNTDDGTRKIGDMILQTGELDADCYLGMYVEYYAQTQQDGELTILYVAPLEANNKIYEVKDRSIEQVSMDMFSFRENDKLKKLKISRIVNVIYNRIACPDFTSEDIKPKYGTVRLIDNNSDGMIDFIDVEAYKSIVVESVSSDENNAVVRSKYTDSAILLSLDKTDTDYEYIADGTRVTSDNITEDDTLTYAASKDGSYYTIYISHRKLKAVPQSINADGDVSVESVIYPITTLLQDYYLSHPDEKIKLGEEYFFHIDYNGEIVAVKLNSSPFSYVYLYNSANSENCLQNKSEIEVLGMDRIWHVYSLAKKVKLNGSRMENESAIINSALWNGSCIRQLIAVSFNENGEVCKIKTPSAIQNDDMIAEKHATLKYRYYGEMFSEKLNEKYMPRYYIKDTPVVIVPKDGDKDSYDISDNTEFSDGSEYDVRLYASEYGIPAACVYEYENNGRIISEDRQLFVISRVSCVKDDEEDFCYLLEGFYDGSEKSIRVTSDADIYRTADNTNKTVKQICNIEDIAKGDIIRYDTDIAGKACEIQLIHKKSDSDNGYFINGTYEFVCGTAVYNNFSKQYIALNIEPSALLAENSIWLNMNQGGYVYLVEGYKTAYSSVRLASSSEIEVNDKVFTWMRTNRPLATVIYRNN